MKNQASIGDYFQLLPSNSIWATLIIVLGAVLMGGFVGTGNWIPPVGVCVIFLIALCSWLNIWAMLLFFLFLMPIVPQSFGVQLSGFPILLTIQRIIVIPMIGVWLSKKILDKTWIAAPRWLFASVLLYFGIRTASSFYAPDTQAAIFRSIADVVEYLGLFLIISELVSSNKRIKIVLITWIAGSLISFIFGVVEIATGWNIVEQLSLTTHLVFWNVSELGHGFQRAFSLFDHPISYGWFASIAFLAALALLIMEKRSSRKSIWWLAMFASMGSIILSFARTSLLGFVVAILVTVLLMSVKQRFQFLGVFVVGAAIIYIVSAMAPTAMESRLLSVEQAFNFNSVENPNAWGVEGRLYLIEKGLSMSVTKPFGYGYTSTSRNRESADFQTTFEGMAGFENHYILILLETGFPGLISFLLPFVWLWRQSYLLIRSSILDRRSDNWILMTFFLSVAALYLVIFWGTSWLGNQEQMYWAILGLAGVFYRGVANGK